MDLSTTFSIALVALLLERLVGYPKHLLQQIGHPVEWMGRLISALDRTLNSAGSSKWLRQLKGVLALLVLIVSVAAVTVPLSFACRSFEGGWVIEALLAVPF